MVIGDKAGIMPASQASFNAQQLFSSSRQRAKRFFIAPLWGTCDPLTQFHLISLAAGLLGRRIDQVSDSNDLR